MLRSLDVFLLLCGETEAQKLYNRLVDRDSLKPLEWGPEDSKKDLSLI